MDSDDDSRPGSSASNSSGGSSPDPGGNDNRNSDDSRPSSPNDSGDDNVNGRRPKSPQMNLTSNQNNNSEHSSRGSSPQQKSRSNSPTKSINSDSNSSSSSSDDDDDDDDNINNSENNITATSRLNNNNVNNINSSSRRSSRSSSECSNGRVSRNQSISPVRRKSRSSRNSSASSNQSIQSENLNKQSNLVGDEDDDLNKEDGAINMSHEDLSDVSDLDSDKQRGVNNRSKQSYNDEDETNPGRNLDENNKNNLDSESVDKAQNNKNLNNEKDKEDEEQYITDLRQKLDLKKHQLKALETKETNGPKTTNGKISESSICDDLIKKHDEDALDFEAEEGECPDVSKEDEQLDGESATSNNNAKNIINLDGEEREEGEELEEGEVSDEEEKRPEETEPKPVCRFYTRGQCTWGMSCRFLHPGVTDKGNYTMFDMVRPVPIPHGAGGTEGGGTGHRVGGPGFGHTYPDYRTERPPLHHRPPPMHHHHHPAYGAAVHHERLLPPVVVADPVVSPMVESAWERGLRTAKEMMRKANKRKEQDMDFEDKKMNLTLSPDELEKDNYYIRDRASPEATPPYPPRPVAHPPVGYGHEPGMYSPPGPGVTRVIRGPQPPPSYDEVDPYGRSTRYRELPPHRMPQYEDERRVRPAREVIVQRVEPVGRGDEWNDPWMRSKSPMGRDGGRERGGAAGVGGGHHDKRVRRDRRSYSSNSSYSSSTTSRSGSSSESSRSPSPDTSRRRYNSTQSSHKSPPPNMRRHIKTGLRSPSPQLRSRRRSPSARRSPITMKKRGQVSPSLIIDKRMALSPVVGGKRKKISPQSRKVTSGDKIRSKRRRGATSSSGSGSSETSGSDSESSYSSSSSSTSRGKTPIKRPTNRPIEKTSVVERKIAKKEITKKRSPISIELKKTSSLGISALAVDRETNSSSAALVAANNKKTTRREELLKQLRAVEDAIARKKSKLN